MARKKSTDLKGFYLSSKHSSARQAENAGRFNFQMTHRLGARIRRIGKSRYYNLYLPKY